MITALTLLTIGLTAVILMYPELTRQRGGKVSAFFPLFIMPVVVGALVARDHLERSKETSFCLSCHVMEDYGKSLYLDDPVALPAIHFQNHRVSPEAACYTCHTNYTMYGDISSKLRGLRHVYVQYLGRVPAAAEIKLYQPFNNRECLHCHAGARGFEENGVHSADPDALVQMKSNQISCLSCHDTVHAIGTLDKAKFWNPKP